MNCPVNYDDNVERANTHPSLLPESGVQTSAIKRPSAPNHRGSVLRNKHKVNTPGISQTPKQAPSSYLPTKVAASGIGQTGSVITGHQLPRKSAKVSFSGAVRRNSTLPQSKIPSRYSATNNCLPRRYSCLGLSSRSSLFC